jgi:hypothetical protein
MARELEQARRWLADALEHSAALQRQEQHLKVLQRILFSAAWS